MLPSFPMLLLLMIGVQIKHSEPRDVLDQTADEIFESVMGDVDHIEDLDLNNKRVAMQNTNRKDITFAMRRSIDGKGHVLDENKFLNADPKNLFVNYINGTRKEMDGKQFIENRQQFLNNRLKLNKGNKSDTLKNTTREAGHILPITPIPLEKMDIKTAKRRLQMAEFEAMLNDTYNPLAAFTTGEDEIQVLNRRFDGLAHMMRQRPSPKVREKKKYYYYNYYHWDYPFRYIDAKYKTLSVMYQVVYMARYRMPYSQLLRKRYILDIKYKLGFCFSLLRQLKLQQLYINNAVAVQGYLHESLYMTIRAHERIMRINVDIRDIIRLIKEMDAERKKREFVDYYYYFIKSTGTHFRRKLSDRNFTTTPMNKIIKKMSRDNY